MPLLFALPGVSGRVLGRQDLPALQRMLERCGDFIQLIKGVRPDPQEAHALLREVPPRCDERLLVGLLTPTPAGGEELAGVLDVASGYPGPGDWYVGLLLLVPEARCQGVGARAYHWFEDYARERGGRAVHLVVQQQNPAARRFWERMGFQVTDSALQSMPARENLVWRMCQVLAPREATHGAPQP